MVIKCLIFNIKKQREFTQKQQDDGVSDEEVCMSNFKVAKQFPTRLAIKEALIIPSSITMVSGVPSAHLHGNNARCFASNLTSNMQA